MFPLLRGARRGAAETTLCILPSIGNAKELPKDIPSPFLSGARKVKNFLNLHLLRNTPVFDGNESALGARGQMNKHMTGGYILYLLHEFVMLSQYLLYLFDGEETLHNPAATAR